MNIIIQLIGILMIVGFSFKHVDDGLKTPIGTYIVAITYLLIAGALIVVPMIGGK